MLTDAELRDFLAEAERYPECIECRIICRLIREIERLKADCRVSEGLTTGTPST